MSTTGGGSTTGGCTGGSITGGSTTGGSGIGGCTGGSGAGVTTGGVVVGASATVPFVPQETEVKIQKKIAGSIIFGNNNLTFIIPPG
jgi:hypothetical protein